MSGEHPGVSAGRDAYVAHRDLIISPAAPVARSAYLEQVESMFPGELIGREAELAELAAFCTAPDDGPGYAWWQAPAWAGKTALLAWFVLHPPAGVRVVSFFVTARYRGQSDRTAFLEIVLEQLAELAGQPLPSSLTEAKSPGWLSRLLKDAAAVCVNRGERLVLVVDGLDEDRGVTVGPDAHSIAALLPASPPEGTRVLVAGRPDPPVPSDVPDWHPLKDARNIRSLSPSPSAEVIRGDAERELWRLLDGGPAERELLGLVAAAGGGLGERDLAELSGLPAAEVRRRLRAVSGRTFHARPTQWGSGTKAYVLAHDEIQNTAVEALAEALDGYHARLHAWADGYRARGWPSGTPEYLLRGYFRLLQQLRDIDRMTACATDQARLDRLLDISGGDTEALTEISTAQEAIIGLDRPELGHMVELAIAHNVIIGRNGTISAEVPAVWALLGEPVRAINFAMSLNPEGSRNDALGLVLETLIEAGELDRAEALALALPAPDWQARVFLRLAAVRAQRQDTDRAREAVRQAETAARTISDPDESEEQAFAFLKVAKAYAAVDEPDRARAVMKPVIAYVTALAHPAGRAQAKQRMLDLLWAPDQAEPVTYLGISSEEYYSDWDHARRCAALVEVAMMLADQDDLDLARRAVAFAGRALDELSPAYREEWAATVMARLAESRTPADFAGLSHGNEPLTDTTFKSYVVEVLAACGDLDRAASVAGSIEWPYYQAQSLVEVIRPLAAAGRIEDARQLARDAEATARTNIAHRWKREILFLVSHALAVAGEFDRAEATARLITEPGQRARAVLHIVKFLSASGALTRAQELARTITVAEQRIEALVALAAASDPARARVLAREAEGAARTARDSPEELLAQVTKAFVAAGELNHARTIADEIEAVARTEEQNASFSSLVGAREALGDLEGAETAARALEDPNRRVRALAQVATAWASCGELHHAREVADEACAATKDITHDLAVQVFARAAAIRSLAASGDIDRAERLAHTVEDILQRELTLDAVVKALVARGEPERALAIARSLRLADQRASSLCHIAVATPPEQSWRLLTEALATNELGRCLAPLAKDHLPIVLHVTKGIVQ